MKTNYSMENEIWKPVVGYEGLYSCSSLGRVRSEDRHEHYCNYTSCNPVNRFRKGTYLKERFDKDGYLIVNLYKDGKMKTTKVHRIIAEAFLPNPDNLPMINHKNEIKTDNRVENIEFCDGKYNSNYGTRNKRLSESKFKKIIQYTLDEKFVKEWSSMTEIEKETGFLLAGISSCCHKRYKTSNGYIWKFKDAS